MSHGTTNQKVGIVCILRHFIFLTNRMQVGSTDYERRWTNTRPLNKTTQRRSEYSIDTVSEFHVKALQAIASEGLADERFLRGGHVRTCPRPCVCNAPNIHTSTETPRPTSTVAISQDGKRLPFPPIFAYVCICVHMCAYMCACMCACLSKCIWLRQMMLEGKRLSFPPIFAYVCVCVRMCACMCAYVRVCVLVCVFLCVHMCVYVCLYVCFYVSYVRACVLACVFVCVLVCVYEYWYVCVCMCACMCA